MGTGPGDVAFMRNSRSNPLGKLTENVSAFKISADTMEGLQALCAQVGMSVPDFVRRLIEIRVHGEDVIMTLERERMAVITGKCDS